MAHRPYCLISGVLFSAVAFAHLLRGIYGFTLTVDDYAIPMYLSWIAVLVAGCLAFWAFRLAQTRGQKV